MREPGHLGGRATNGSPHTSAADAILVQTLREARYSGASSYRRHLCRVALVVNGASEVHTARHRYAIAQPALVYLSARVPSVWMPAEGPAEPEGGVCAFTEAFLHSAMRGARPRNSVFYQPDANPVYLLDDAQRCYFSEVFTRMHRDLRTDYAHKYDLLRSHLALIVHEVARPGAYLAP